MASAIGNEKAALEIQTDFGSLDAFLWLFVDGKSAQSHWVSTEEVSPKTDTSERMNKELANRGFKFVGATGAGCTGQHFGGGFV